DPRAIYLTVVGKELALKNNVAHFAQIADILEKVMETEKGIYPNVDFPAAYAYYALGIPIDLYTPIFVVARVSGWSAHVLEQLSDNRLIAPAVLYEGPPSVEFVLLDQRYARRSDKIVSVRFTPNGPDLFVAVASERCPSADAAAHRAGTDHTRDASCSP